MESQNKTYLDEAREDVLPIIRQNILITRSERNGARKLHREGDLSRDWDRYAKVQTMKLRMWEAALSGAENEEWLGDERLMR